MPGSDDPLLAGVTVLDFTRVLAGPYCTRLLADLGARVIKVERPGEGDDTRRGHVQLERERTDQATYFIRINAGKSSLALDLAHPKAREVVLDLARASDVVVENFLPGVVAKLGCDHAALSAVKPDVVYCSISGFGQSGPLRHQPAFHHIINAMSGVMHLEQQTDPAPRPGYLQAADVLAGTHAFGVILAGLWRRKRTGRGAYLDVSMLECMVAAEDINYGGMLNAGAEYRGPAPGHDRPRDRRPPRGDADGRGAPALAAPRRDDGPARAGLRSALRHAGGAPRALGRAAPDHLRVARPLQDRRGGGERAHGGAGSRRRRPLAGRGRRPPAPRRASGVPRIDHPGRGTVRITAVPFHVDQRPVAPRGAAPYRVGEHTRAVLRDVLGYSTERVEELGGSG